MRSVLFCIALLTAHPSLAGSLNTEEILALSTAEQAEYFRTIIGNTDISETGLSKSPEFLECLEDWNNGQEPSSSHVDNEIRTALRMEETKPTTFSIIAVVLRYCVGSVET